MKSFQVLVNNLQVWQMPQYAADACFIPALKIRYHNVNENDLQDARFDFSVITEP